MAVTYGDVRVNLFFVKMGKSPTWKLLATTDLTINFQKLMDVYQIRWSIEIFFRESKQYLHLGKCKSISFDAQIADATISLVQYTLLAFHQQMCIRDSQTTHVRFVVAWQLENREEKKYDQDQAAG